MVPDHDAANQNKRSLVHVTTDSDMFFSKLSTTVVETNGVNAHVSDRPDLIVPYARPNAPLLIHIHETTSYLAYDLPFSVTAEVVDDPDPSEPVEPGSTEIILEGAPPVGSVDGGITKPDDTDTFTITVPSLTRSRKVIYLHVTSAAVLPQLPFSLGYTIAAPNGAILASGVAGEGSGETGSPAADLPTAVTAEPGIYTLTLRGVVPSGGIMPGDLRAQYHVDVELLDDLDANEPNDTLPTATTVALTTLGDPAQTFSGRIGSVGDSEVSVRPNAPIVEGARGPGAIDGGGTSMDAKHTTS